MSCARDFHGVHLGSAPVPQNQETLANTVCPTNTEMRKSAVPVGAIEDCLAKAKNHSSWTQGIRGCTLARDTLPLKEGQNAVAQMSTNPQSASRELCSPFFQEILITSFYLFPNQLGCLVLHLIIPDTPPPLPRRGWSVLGPADPVNVHYSIPLSGPGGGGEGDIITLPSPKPKLPENSPSMGVESALSPACPQHLCNRGGGGGCELP